ncbi:tryptophan-rich sensory protein [bacterium]|nr:tryptophan-rich sensory protein [bacterium]
MFNSSWYDSLTKPFLSPPNWLFVPVWIILYITIFVSLVLYIITPDKEKTFGYVAFGVQLILNLAWSPVFFVMQNIPLALVIVLLLDMAILLTILEFYSVSKISGIILIPYFLWSMFATYLTLGYLILN